MEDLKIITLSIAYLSIFTELVFLSVPSVASTYQLIITDGSHKKVSSRLSKIKDWQAWKKLLFLFAPAIVNITVFLFPVLYVLGVFKYDIISNEQLSVIIGLVFLIIGRLITFLSVIQIRKVNKSDNQQKFLHQKGWFKWSRNPGLLGMYIFIFGVWLLFSHPLFLGGILFYIGYMHFKVLLEEDYLIEKFGIEYQKYLNQTKRYF